MMSVVAVLCVNMLTANMLLSVFFVSGVLADCPQDSALFITAPKKIEALSGSCLQIPCNFSAKPAEPEFNSTRETFGVWIKSESKFYIENNVIFNSSKTVNSYPMNITGNLRKKNCSTLFSSLITSYTDTYYFRIENRPFMATAICDPLQITVKDSPPSPSIEISGEADLKEKESVTITCSAFTPCPHSPPKLTWNLQQDSHNKIEQNTDGTFTSKIQETITLSDQHDGYNITCSVTYPVNEGQDVQTAEETKTLSVSYAPKNTSVSISPSGLVSAGSWVNLSCSSRAKPPVSRFTWFKNSKDGLMNVSEGQIYSFKVTKVTDIDDYYCAATNDLGYQTSWIDLNSADHSLLWGSAVGIIIIIIIILICFAVCVWRFKSKHQTPQETQSQSSDELALQVLASNTEENIQYEDISFLKQRPEPSSHSVQDSGQHQDPLYAQVNVSKPANSLRQTDDGLKDLYAQDHRVDELDLQMPASNTEENIHYGEIDFSQRGPELPSDSAEDSGQLQDTLYVQVNVSKPVSSVMQTADGFDDLYAQVKKKRELFCFVSDTDYI